MLFLTFDPKTGVVTPGIAVVTLKKGPGSLPYEAGVVVFRGGAKYVVVISLQQPPKIVNGRVLEAEFGNACAAQEWPAGKEPVSYHALRRPTESTDALVVAIPGDPTDWPAMNRKAGTTDEERWEACHSFPVSPAFDVRMVEDRGLPYAFYSVSYGDTCRVRIDNADWVITRDHATRNLKAVTFAQYEADEKSAAEARGAPSFGL